MIRVIRGDLLAAEVDAVVRSVRSDGDPISALGRRLGEAAGPPGSTGPGPVEESPVGMATLTPGGSLPASFLIHVTLQSMEEPVSATIVERGVLNSLRRAADFGIESLGLPPLGVGPGNLETEEAARILARVLADHVAGGQPPTRIEVYVESEYDEDVFRNALSAAGLSVPID